MVDSTVSNKTDLWQLSATDIASAVTAGDVSASEVAAAAIGRMQTVNSHINAIVDHNEEDTLAQAQAVDQRLQNAQHPLPLAGVPVTIKVNVDQAGYATTNGLRNQASLVAAHSSPVLDNLIRAGAVIIGRTNTPAFSLRWFCRNSLHGHTRNPLNPALTPGGSSGGAGAAVASGIGALAHGTDIAGSVRYPAYACGVHGLRPSLGRVAAFNASGGDRYIGGQLMAVSGPLARSIDDLELAFHAMSQADTRDPWWQAGPGSGQTQTDYPRTAALWLQPEGLDTAAPIIEALQQAADKLRAEGWQVDVLDDATAPPIRALSKLNLQLWMAEMQQAGSAMVASENDPDAVFVFGELCKAAGTVDMDTLMQSLQQRATLIRQWQQFLDTYPLLLMPVCGELPFKDLEDIESPATFARILEAQLPQTSLPVTGLPGLTVTTGVSNAVPVGVQLVSRKCREDILFAAGRLL